MRHRWRQLALKSPECLDRQLGHGARRVPRRKSTSTVSRAIRSHWRSVALKDGAICQSFVLTEPHRHRAVEACATGMRGGCLSRLFRSYCQKLSCILPCSRHFIRRVRMALGAIVFTAESRWTTTPASDERSPVTTGICSSSEFFDLTGSKYATGAVEEIVLRIAHSFMAPPCGYC